MIRNLLLSGGPTHDFAASGRYLVELLGAHDVETTVVTDPDEAVELLAAEPTGAAADFALLTVHALRWRMEEPRYEALREGHAYALGPAAAAVLDGFVRAGGGLLALHTAVVCFDAEPAWRALCGAAWSWDRSSHPPLGPVAVALTASGRSHPITAAADDFVVEDEAYGFLDEAADIEPLLVASHGGRTHPLLWVREVGAGRVVTDLLGHGVESLSHPTHSTVLARAARWAARPSFPGAGSDERVGRG